MALAPDRVIERLYTGRPELYQRFSQFGSFMRQILVIGATGNVSRYVVSQLEGAGARFRGMSRNPDAAGLRPHVDVMRGDLMVPSTLDQCLVDVDRVLPDVDRARGSCAGTHREARQPDRVPDSSAQDAAPVLSAT